MNGGGRRGCPPLGRVPRGDPEGQVITRAKGSEAENRRPQGVLTETVPDPAPRSAAPARLKVATSSGGARKVKRNPKAALWRATVEYVHVRGFSETGLKNPHLIASRRSRRQ